MNVRSSQHWSTDIHVIYALDYENKFKSLALWNFDRFSQDWWTVINVIYALEYGWRPCFVRYLKIPKKAPDLIRLWILVINCSFWGWNILTDPKLNLKFSVHWKNRTLYFSINVMLYIYTVLINNVCSFALRFCCWYLYPIKKGILIYVEQ